MLSYILVFMLVNAAWLTKRLDLNGRESDGKLLLGMFTKPDEEDMATGYFNTMVNNFFACTLNLIRSLRLSAWVRTLKHSYRQSLLYTCTYTCRQSKAHKKHRTCNRQDAMHNTYARNSRQDRQNMQGRLHKGKCRTHTHTQNTINPSTEHRTQNIQHKLQLSETTCFYAKQAN